MNKDNYPNDKKNIRKTILNVRNSIPADERVRLSKAIAINFFNYIKKTARSVALYYSTGSEADTNELVDGFNGAKLLYPKVSGNNQLLWGEPPLMSGCMGIVEPTVTSEFDAEIIVVPCVAFDLKKYRLGYGKGYFDRFLSGRTNLLKICLAYESQKIASVYPEIHDIPMDAVVTDMRIY